MYNRKEYLYKYDKMLVIIIVSENKLSVFYKNSLIHLSQYTCDRVHLLSCILLLMNTNNIC